MTEHSSGQISPVVILIRPSIQDWETYYFPHHGTELPGTTLFKQAAKAGHVPPIELKDWSNVAYINDDADMPWISHEFKNFMVKSRQIIVDINKKFTGKKGAVTDKDLLPLKELFS